MSKNKILQVENLRKYFPVQGNNLFRKDTVKAVNDVSFHLYKGETYGLVGESGSGKSTLGRTLLRIIEPTSGKIMYKDKNILDLNNRQMSKLRMDLQMVFQDPYSSLNPRMKVGKAILEPMNIHKIGDKENRKETVFKLLEKVGLKPEHYNRFQKDFSGGQRQRLVIARSLAVKPKLLVCDESVSALDVSVQSQIINLFKDLQEEYQLTYLFISHDLSVIRYISDRVGVMYLGQLVEEGKVDDLFENPLHPYTQSLISSIPRATNAQKRDRIVLKGDIPSPIDLPKGCFFYSRCPLAKDICKNIKPQQKCLDKEHWVACHLYN